MKKLLLCLIALNMISCSATRIVHIEVPANTDIRIVKTIPKGVLLTISYFDTTNTVVDSLFLTNVRTKQ